MIAISNIIFTGPFDSAQNIKNKSGVYVILTKNIFGRYEVLDIGESFDLKTRLLTHERATRWSKHKKQGLFCAVYYCDERKRQQLDERLRTIYSNFVL